MWLNRLNLSVLYIFFLKLSISQEKVFQTMHSSMYSSLRNFRRMLQILLLESDLKVVQGDCDIYVYYLSMFVVLYEDSSLVWFRKLTAINLSINLFIDQSIYLIDSNSQSRNIRWKMRKDEYIKDCMVWKSGKRIFWD